MTTQLGTSRYLDAVDVHVRTLLESVEGPISAAAQRACAAGGKRLRPLLVLAGIPTATPHEDVYELSVRAGAAVELVHTASLVHDDLLDDAVVRRGEPTIGARSGRMTATAAGDLLFSLAFRTLVGARRHTSESHARRAVTILAHVARRLAEGEALQALQLRDVDLREPAYRDRCAAKTGVLFRAALELGATFGDADAPDVAALGDFGERIGVAFQVTDDVLDCGDDAALLGKLPGADVRDGTITLPMMYAIERDPSLRSTLASTVATDRVDDVLDQIRRSGGVVAARARALELRDEASAILRTLDARFDVTLLESVAARSVDRIS